MTYNLVLRVLVAPLTIDHGILALDSTPGSGFFTEQNRLGFDGGGASAFAEREARDLPREARAARARQAVAEASASGPLHRALVREAAGDKRSLGVLQGSADTQIAALAPTLRMGEAVAYAAKPGAGIWDHAHRLRVLDFDDAELLVGFAAAARERILASDDPLLPSPEAAGIPTEDAIRAFVAEHAGSVCFITRG